MIKLFLDISPLSQDKHLFTTCQLHKSVHPTQICPIITGSDWITFLANFPWLLLAITAVMTPHWHRHPRLLGPDYRKAEIQIQSGQPGEHEGTWAMSLEAGVSESYERHKLITPRQNTNNGQTNKQPWKCHTALIQKVITVLVLTWHSRLVPPYPRPPPIRRGVPRPRRRPRRCGGAASPSCQSRGWNKAELASREYRVRCDEDVRRDNDTGNDMSNLGELISPLLVIREHLASDWLTGLTRSYLWPWTIVIIGIWPENAFN